MMRPLRFLFFPAIALSVTAVAWGYALLGSTWNTDRPVIQLQLGASGRLIDGSASWNAVAEGALATWNSKISRLQFRVVRNSSAPIGDGNGFNNVFFSTTFYGSNFSDAVAITSEWDNGAGDRIEGDTVFNSNLDWNSYRGDLVNSRSGDTLYDLRRVALHEFGHLLGLDHPDEHGQRVNAIMNAVVSDLDHLTPDDIAGSQALYGARAASVKPRAIFIHPTAPRVTIRGATYAFRGTADVSRAKRVFLSNSRLGSKRYFKAVGVARWHRKIGILPGKNIVRLYVDLPGGGRVRVAQRTVIRN